MDWCGIPNFEEDYMMVDWVAITTFEYAQGYHNNNPNIGLRRDRERYCQAHQAGTRIIEPTTQMPETNYISNRNFENTQLLHADPRRNAWQTIGDATIPNNPALAQSGTRSLRLANNGRASQVIEAVYDGFVFDFSAYTRSMQGTGRFEIEFHNDLNMRVGELISIPFAYGEWTQVREFLTAPTNSSRMTIRAIADSGAIVHVDNMSLRLVNPETLLPVR